MITFFDIRTLSIVLGLTIFNFWNIHGFFSVNRQVYPGFIAWTIATLLFSTSFFLIGFRHIFPDFISIIVANAQIYASLPIFYFGFKSFAEKKFKIYRHIVLWFGFSFALIPFFTYITPSVNVRISLVAFTGTLYFLLCTRVLVSEIKYDLGKLKTQFTITLLLLSAFLLFRGIFYLLPGNIIKDFMSAGNFQGITLLIINILSISFLVCLVQFNSQILKSELHQEQKRVKESEERFRQLSENINDVFWLRC